MSWTSKNHSATASKSDVLVKAVCFMENISAITLKGLPNYDPNHNIGKSITELKVGLMNLGEH